MGDPNMSAGTARLLKAMRAASMPTEDATLVEPEQRTHGFAPQPMQRPGMQLGAPAQPQEPSMWQAIVNALRGNRQVTTTPLAQQADGTMVATGDAHPLMPLAPSAADQVDQAFSSSMPSPSAPPRR